jgi:CheY-like chemotaxis protein
MDFNMPVVDGMEATRRLKANPETRQIPVVALTANDCYDIRQQAVLAGVNVFLTKPTELSVLLAQLRLLAPVPHNVTASM